MSKDDALKELAAKVASGVQVNPEDGKRVLIEAGVEPDDIAGLAATPTDTVEWQDPSTRQHRSPAVAPESLVKAEEQGLKDLESVEARSENTGTDSNDPAKNLMATGPADPDGAGAIGASGQVPDTGDPAGDKAEKATAKASK